MGSQDVRPSDAPTVRRSPPLPPPDSDDTRQPLADDVTFLVGVFCMAAALTVFAVAIVRGCA